MMLRSNILHHFRYSTVSKTSQNLLPTVDILSFIQTSLLKLEGNSHFWLNKASNTSNLSRGVGVFLILVGNLGDALNVNQNTVGMFGKLKTLQQRYSFVEVMALEYGKSTSITDISKYFLQRIVKEYITFPVLISDKNFFETTIGPFYIISQGFKNPSVYFEEDVDLDVLEEAIQELNMHSSECIKNTWVKPVKDFEHPGACLALQNLLLFFPDCISADERGNRLFLSDANHHRIIVLNCDGKILDAIGSSPGFEDGVFENAKLMRPAASFYNASEGFLYFVDSENHAIRKADMNRRIVETIFPATLSSKKEGLWKWIQEKIWTGRDVKSEEFIRRSFLFPWHLLKSQSNDLFVLDQSFGILWIIDSKSSSIREVVKERSKIMEICEQIIMEKTSSLRQIPFDWPQLQFSSNCAFDEIRHATLVSSLAICQENLVLCDTAGQMVVKFNRENGSFRTISFSNFGIIGLPYWFLSPLEQVYSINMQKIEPDHVQNFNLLPGKVDIELIISIPHQTELVEQPQEGCIWRQARGAAVEISGVENTAASTEKVGIAQQWYDELDHLCYSTSDYHAEEESKLPCKEVEEGVARIGCTINTSPGTSEVVIDAALYLRLKNISVMKNHETAVANILDPDQQFKRDLLMELLTTSTRDLADLVFMKRLHVRLLFDSLDHPKADNLRDTIVTDSSVKVHVIL